MPDKKAKGQNEPIPNFEHLLPPLAALDCKIRIRRIPALALGNRAVYTRSHTAEV